MLNSNLIKESVFFFLFVSWFFHKSPIDISQNTSVLRNIVRETLMYVNHWTVFHRISASFGLMLEAVHQIFCVHVSFILQCALSPVFLSCVFLDWALDSCFSYNQLFPCILLLWSVRNTEAWLILWVCSLSAQSWGKYCFDEFRCIGLWSYHPLKC